MMQMRNLWFVLCVGLVRIVGAVPPDVAFTHTFAERAEFFSIAVIPDDTLNGLLLSGTSTVSQYQYFAVRVDSTGDTVYVRRFGNADQCRAMCFDSGGGVTYAGTTSQTGLLNYRMIHAEVSGDLIGSYEYGADQVNETIRSIAEHRPGWYFVAGDEDSGSSQVGNGVLMRVAFNTEEDWRITVPMAWRTAALNYNGVSLFLYGTTDTISHAGNRDYFELAADTLGEAGVYRAFGGPRMDRAAAATQLASGVRVVVGTSNSFGTDSTQNWIWILATSASGDSLWSRFWRSTGSATATGICRTSDLDSGFVVTGYVAGPDSGTQRGILAKYRANGDSLWTLMLPGESHCRFNSVAQDARFRYHVCGSRRVGNEDRAFYLYTEFDPNAPGQQPPLQFSLLSPPDQAVVTSDTIFFDWETAIDPEGDAVRYALVLDSDTMFQQGIPFGPLNFSHFIWRSDTDEVAIYWRVIAQDIFNNTRICDERHRVFYRSIPDSSGPFSLVSPDSGLVLTQPWSEFRWFAAADDDALDTILYNLHFVTPDTELVTPAITDTFAAINFASHPIIEEGEAVEWFVTVSSRQPVMQRQSRERWTIVTWSASTNPAGMVPGEFGITSVYPNPFNSATTLEIWVDHEREITLDVYNIEGRLVSTILNSQLEPGVHRLEWQPLGASSGIYFARIQSGEHVQTVKLMLLK